MSQLISQLISLSSALRRAPQQHLKGYYYWLHGQWPSGQVDPLPMLDEHGQTNVRGVYIAGELTGLPLLKFAARQGAERVRHLCADPAFERARARTPDDVYDLIIIGCGVAGASAALEAQRRGLKFIIYEAKSPFSTLRDFPRGKPIYAYPSGFETESALNVERHDKESLLASLDQQLHEAGVEVISARVDQLKRSDGLISCEPHSTRALRVLIAIGKSGEPNRLNVVGEDDDHVHTRLYDPHEHRGAQAVVVGGGDSAVEAAIALAQAGAGVSLVHRGDELTRPKPVNLEALQRLRAPLAPDDQSGAESADDHEPARASLGQVRVYLQSQVAEIKHGVVKVSRSGETGSRGQVTLSGDLVFVLTGRRASYDLLRRSGVQMRGERSLKSALSLIGVLAFCALLYHWKSYSWFPFDAINPSGWIQSLSQNLSDGLSARAQDKTTLLYTLLRSASQPSFYYTLIYSLTIGYFGWRRIKRRRTPYVKSQTLSLLFFQWIPLFILPELILPLLGRNGFFSEGAALRGVADLFFESYDGGIGEERAYWRAYGFILAWPLMVYNWLTHQPIYGWLILGSVQTFVIIPLIVYRWGKGAFCSWICSCGALAETLGDTHRHKMPRGARWNKLNMLGQVILALAFLMLGLRVWGWVDPQSWAAAHIQSLLDGPSPLSYKWSVDVALAGFLGVGLYFHFSGRTWCRFACPLAALMHIYARFSRFRIFSDREKCISCNVCTSVCHQGIDVMSFASRGAPLEDPQCVRCSACVEGCPTGVLSFGRLDQDGAPKLDKLSASLVQISEPRARD